MDDLHLSTIFSGLIAIFLLFLFPTYMMLSKNDQLIQNYVNNKTSLFVDTVESSGRISKSVYSEFINYLDSTGYLFEITIEHQKKIVTPVYDDNGVFRDTYTTYYEYVYTDDILDKVYNDGSYDMTYGDYITVNVKCRTASHSSNLLSSVLNRGELESMKIQFTDGGLIWDDSY